MSKVEFCQDAGAICNKIVRDEIFEEFFRELPDFAALRCPFHLPQCGQGEDFQLFFVV